MATGKLCLRPAAIVLGILGLLVAACAPAGAPRPGAQTGAPTLTGAGASFPYPIYAKWFDVYAQKTGVRINYQSIGSGGGIRQILEGTVDFGASDAPMTDDQLARAPGKILHIPTVLGAVVVVYNLPELGGALKLSPETLAAIYLGQVTRWNDPRIAAENPGLKLPDTPIAVVYRSDGSGTTYVFTDYLSAVSPAWKERVGRGTSVNWPVGLGSKGNEGVTGQVKQTPGAIGYVEVAYAVQNRLPQALLRNRAGNYVEPTLENITAAAAGAAPTLPEDLRVSIVDAPGPNSYPISAFTYILVYQEQRDPVKGRALAEFLWWALDEGQAYAPNLHYAPLPEAVRAKARALIKTISYQGKSLLEN
ncbi:MAG: phosphate ABC transporter substrate-binding protein PstS [Chloroflexota bacterium]